MPGATTIGRTRVHDCGLDPTVARVRLAQVLAGAEVEPPQLAPAAILCVRRVRDPSPGTLRLDAGTVRPPRAWERALAGEMATALRGASRPAREAVPPDAGAILFADRAELLTCLALDCHDGVASSRWWWHGLRRAAGDLDPLAAEWLAAPEHVPAAIELLAEVRQAVAIVAWLPPTLVTQLVERVARAFGVAQLRPKALAEPPAGASTRARRLDMPKRAAPMTHPATSGAGRPGHEPRPTAPTPARPLAPWRAVASETLLAPLERDRELLLGLSLTLRRAPALARSQSFAGAAAAWYAASASHARPAVTTVPDAQALPARASWRPADAARRGERGGGRGAAAGGEPRPRGATGHTRRHHDASFGAAPSGGAPADERRARRGSRENRRHGRPVERGAAAGRAGAMSSAAEPTVVMATELGGAFYLLNLALFLGLYADFTRPLGGGLALDPWDYVALLTRALLGPAALEPGARDDPLWALLARLARRPRRAPPGRGFAAPLAWRTPLDWLEPFARDGEWRWSAAGGTLRIVHPMGFAAVALPRTRATPAQQLARELRRVQPLDVHPRRARMPPEPATPLRRWTRRLAAYADARLRVALGLEPSASLPDTLLRHNARVRVTPSHVDVTLELAKLPLAVRFAGLDRTPGWIPATGRFVGVHFE